MKGRRTRQQVYEYTAFFEKNEDGGYTVTVPSLLGLVTEGKNLEDARAMAEDAIRCYVEGLKKLHGSIPREQSAAQMRIAVSV